MSSVLWGTTIEVLPRSDTDPDPPLPTGRGKRFVTNVIWNWVGVATTLASGLLISPFLIRRLGPEAYGVWTLSFGLVDYYWFFDFGFRSATVKYVAHYTATGESRKVGEVISTSLLYALAVAAFVLVAVGLSAHRIVHFIHVAPGFEHAFVVVIYLITVSWAMGIVLGLSTESLEAVQRFDLTSRVSVIATTTRLIGQAIVLYFGYGLIPLAAVTVSGQMLGYTLNFISFRRIFKDVPIGFRMGSRATLRLLNNFGIHSFLITISTQLQNQTAPFLIGHFLSAAFAGFYNAPMRLIQYAAEFIGRIGIVTNSNAAELSAKGDLPRLRDLAVYTNRYCLAIFMPLAILLWTYGGQVILLWMGPKAAPYSTPVLPILLGGYLVGVVGQFSSAMLLMGMGKPQLYARGMFAEFVLGLVLLSLIVPRYGIVGAAWVAASLIAANRGCYLSYVVSHTVGLNFFTYVNRVYTLPFLSAIPAFLISLALKNTVLPGHGVIQVAAALAIAAVANYSIAFFTCAEPHHRTLIYSEVARRFNRPAP